MRLHIIERIDDIHNGQFAARSMDHLSSSDGQPRKVTANDIAKKLNLLDAMRTIVKGWDSVKHSAIVNCWRKAGFETDNTALEDEPKIVPPPEMTTDEFSKWVDIDRDTPTNEELTLEDEENQLINNIVGCVEAVVIDSDDDDADVQEDIPSNAEMRHCLRRLQVGLESRDFKHMGEYTRLSSRISDMLRENLTQKSIDDFLKQ